MQEVEPAIEALCHTKVLLRLNGKLLGVDNAGPMLLVRLPPGDYTVDASYGGRNEQRQVRLARGSTTVNLRWPDEAKTR